MVDDPTNRTKCKRGEDLPQSKLTESKVRAARKLHRYYLAESERLRQEYSIKGLAVRYGVSAAAMEKALSGITWSHVV